METAKWWCAGGRSWVFASADINTEVIMPRAGYDLSAEARRDLIMSATRPGWAGEVRDGDVLVVGNNFGVGSSRPVVNFLRELGIVGIVGDSLNGIFLRNCVSYAMPILECAHVVDATSEGDVVQLDMKQGQFTNITTSVVLYGDPLPPMLLETIRSGGTMPQLRSAGYLEQPIAN